MNASIARPHWGWEALPARISATLLVGSSAGLGALSAWSTGSQHGPALGGLMVAAALGLELAKPAAVVGAIQAGWRRPVRAAALALLGLGAVAFSLSAELSLMAGARGDAVADRAGSAQRISDARATQKRLATELAGLPMERPSATVQAEMAIKLSSRTDLDGCDAKWLPSSKARAVCIEVAGLRAELARAQRREDVAGKLATVEATLERLGAPRTADPAAAALVAYAKPVGFLLDPGAVGQWLALVPVLALEIGSALAGLLMAGGTGSGVRLGGQSGGRSRPLASASVGVGPIADLVPAVALPRVVTKVADSPDAAPSDSPPPSARPQSSNDDQRQAAVDAKVLAAVKAAGGRWSGSQRQLAGALGVGRSAICEALKRLADNRTIQLATNARGSSVALAR